MTTTRAHVSPPRIFVMKRPTDLTEQDEAPTEPTQPADTEEPIFGPTWTPYRNLGLEVRNVSTTHQPTHPKGTP